MSVAPVLRKFCAVTALTAIGTSDSAWLRRVAVMMMLPVSTGCCSRAWLETAGGCFATPWVGGAVVGLPDSVLGGCVCANAGVAKTVRPAESSHADLRIMFLSPSGVNARSLETLIFMQGQRKRLRSRNDENAAVLQQFCNTGVSKDWKDPASGPG